MASFDLIVALPTQVSRIYIISPSFLSKFRNLSSVCQIAQSSHMPWLLFLTEPYGPLPHTTDSKVGAADSGTLP